VSDEREIEAFITGVEELGRSNPRTVAELMETANKWGW
jgi:hypothetical protein